MKGKIYMIPSTLGDGPIENVIPQGITSLVLDIKFYIVENVRTARRFLKKLSPEIEIDPLTFFILDKHTKAAEISQFISPAINGENIGVISEAGCPGVADPGADIISIAHLKGIQVIPLVGPSSIVLALMASGMNGQNFAFTGYLPIKPQERIKSIKHLENRSSAENQTQIFIETPYRNNHLVEDILSSCSDTTLFCIACDITSETEYISTRTIQAWKKAKPPDLHKRPCIFLLHH
ncbi:MAG: SAM-dependent methyltransferase [Bacteroidales bacterium]|nr:SAM-dependent methyltransferase [Bacteroidales bacterium]MCF8456622.1 SAM-dependent methyltransferase [Bacteroidales bacterium]